MVSDTVTPLAVRIETAAKMLDTSPSTVAAWLRTGRLPGLKVGRSWRVRISDLRALVDAEAVTRCAQTADAPAGAAAWVRNGSKAEPAEVATPHRLR